MSAPQQGDGTAAGQAGIELCLVRVGATTFGVPIQRMLEILGAPAIQPVPLAPSFIGGMLHYRGEALTAVSLRSLLDMPHYEGQPDVVVLESPDGCFGLLVDEVSEVMTMQPEWMQNNPSALDERHRHLFAGTCKLKDGLLVMLDPDRLDPMQLLHCANGKENCGCAR